jgi:signal transduction histidine kinase
MQRHGNSAAPIAVSEAVSGAAERAEASAPLSLLAILGSFVRTFAAGVLDASPGPFEVARRRALRLQAALGLSTGARREAALSLAGDGLLGLVIDEGLDEDAVEDFVQSVADALERDRDALALSLFMRVCRAPALGTLPPRLAAEALLKLVSWLAPVAEVSLWSAETGKPVRCELVLGAAAPSRSARTAARAVTGGREAPSPGRQSSVCAVAVERWHNPTAAIVARGGPGHHPTILAFLEEAADALTPALEREALLELSTEREHSLVAASERRLMRIGFDLHDGALQEVAALGGDLQLVRGRLGSLLDESLRDRVLGCFDDLAARLGEIDGSLRELAHSLESRSAVSQPLGSVLRRETNAFERRSGIGVALDLEGNLDGLTNSQKIVIFRVVQEALNNVREHSGAGHVAIEARATATHTEVQIADDGRGFEVESTLTRAAREGRLGLVGIVERIRLLGGTISVASRPSGTTIAFALPRWAPLLAEGTAARDAILY